MNLAVHGLEGNVVEANTFYTDAHELLGKCDFVMANPPFNVDMVDAEKVKTDPRLPFGLPGVSKGKSPTKGQPGEKKKDTVSNGNYLWISYFWSYLNKTGRAGFVMSSQASSAGHGEADVRRKLVKTGDDRKDIEGADWSLTPGRYTGVAPAEVDDDFDFEQAITDIHVELADLNLEAVELAKKIQKNFEGLGV